MPNWCYNTVNIYGPTDEVKRLRATIATEQGGWRDLMPMPEALKGTTSPTPDSPDPHPHWANLVADGSMTQERYDELVASNIKRYEDGQKVKELTGYTDWYEWCVSNWGTKWGDCDTQIGEVTQVTPTIAHFHSYFETAWGPYDERFWEIATSNFEVAVIIWNTEESDAFYGTQAFYKGERIYDDQTNEYINLPEYDDDDPQAYFDAKDKWYSFASERSEDNAISALCDLLEGDDRWNNWISLPNRVRSQEVTTH
jgi:hypothetical protein